MLRFSANLSFLFTDLSLPDRIDAAGACGFRGVEYMSPYESDVADLRARLQRHGIEQVLFNLPMGNFAAGERGFASDPARVEEFKAGVASAVACARELQCTRVNCLVGLEIPGLDPVVARKTMVANLRYAAQELAKTGVTLVIEPLNRIDTPGFLIGTTAEGLALIDEVAEPNFKLQYDCYHAQRAEGNIIATLRAHVGRIGHVQLADSPDRHEPGTGELAYERILPALDGLGYTGWVGLEYRPSLPVPQTFAWIDALQPREATR
jgi:hydroxypyruvate isomerase